MAWIRKRNGLYQVNIRKKGYPNVFKTFHDLKDATNLIHLNYQERGVSRQTVLFYKKIVHARFFSLKIWEFKENVVRKNKIIIFFIIYY